MSTKAPLSTWPVSSPTSLNHQHTSFGISMMVCWLMTHPGKAIAVERESKLFASIPKLTYHWKSMVCFVVGSRNKDLRTWNFFQNDRSGKTRNVFYFRGGITVVTETGQITQSHLVIRNAKQSDEGNYTCKPSIFKSASLRLFVIDGKKFNAM